MTSRTDEQTMSGPPFRKEIMAWFSSRTWVDKFCLAAAYKTVDGLVFSDSLSERVLDVAAV